ncbi:MAG: hypothetical protein QOH01_3497 [Verrucomicrobiota bacterium]|jgi:hypothetical protein
MNEEPQNKPPYVAYTTFKNFLASLNKNGIIPSRIDKTLMPGHSGSTQSYLMAALRFFKLIDQTGAPTDDLQDLVRAEGEARKPIWCRIVESAYDPVIGNLDLSRATLGMLNEKFAAQDLTGDTLRKCESFFAAAAEDAGITLSPQLKPNTRGASGPRKARKKGQPKPSADNTSSGDEFGDDGGKAGNGANQPPSQFVTLVLDKEGRSIKLKGPTTITNAELERVQQWLKYQFILED